MQLVIDIDENVFTRLFDNGDEYVADMRRACVAIRKGIPLPKGHGRIIDESKITHCEYNEYAIQMITNAPTIIKAEKEES